jgi:hypothetical protein
LSRIEKDTFKETGLVGIILPASVKILGERCFAGCKSLSSVTFESGSQLLGRESEVLHGRAGGHIERWRLKDRDVIVE